MEKNQNNENEIDLLQICMVLLGKIWVIFIVGVVCALAAFGYYNFIATKQYTSTTQIFVMDKESGNITSSDISVYSAVSNDYIKLIQTRPVLEKVIAELGLNMKTEQLSGAITATKEDDSRIISISVEDESPVVAKRIADAVAQATAEQIYDVMEAELVNVVQPGNVPESPSSPATTKNTIIAFMIGAVVTCIIIIIRFLLDDTIKVAEDVERYLDITVIGTIPVFGEGTDNSKSKKKKKKPVRNTVKQRK